MKRTLRTTVPTVGALMAARGLPAGAAQADSTVPRIDLSHRIGDAVTVQAPSGLAVTATLPTGTTLGGSAFGSACAGRSSGWTSSTDSTLTFTLASATAAPAATASARTPATAPAPRASVPAGVTEQVPYTPDS